MPRRWLRLVFVQSTVPVSGPSHILEEGGMMKSARVFPLALVVLFTSFVFLQNAAPAQAVPDLVVSSAVRTGSTVCFTVLNQGSSQADKGHATALYANGKLLDKEVHLGNLNPWESAKGCFGVAADGHPLSSLTVCADADQAINENKENNNCLTVTEPSQDTQAPVISKVTVTDITATNAKISWGTDESADSRVVYGRDARLFAFQAYRQEMVHKHELTLSGLTPGATYACKVISSDGSGNSAQSKVHYFQTLAESGQKPDIRALSSLYAKGSLPPQFHVDTPDLGADRVAFFCNGELVGIDYTAPFVFSLFPDFLGQSAADLIGSNSVVATIFGRDGQSSTMTATMDLAESCLTSGVQVRIDAPDPQVLYTNGTTAESGEVQLWVTAVEPGEIEFAPHPRGPYGSGGGGPTTSFIHNLRFFVGGDEIFPTDLGAWGYDEDIHIFTFNPSGLPLGEHRVRVEATASSGCRFVSTTTLTVAERHAQLDVARQVTREGSSFRVQLDITNVGQVGADVSLVSDSMVGFMPSRTTTRQQISFDENTLSGSIDCNDPLPFGGELDPGESHSIHFYAVPILFESDPDYRFGDSVRVVYTDHTGQWFDETLDLTTERTDTAHLDLALETALNASDYLMVTDPSNLLAQNDRGDVMELFNWTSMLARERNAVLGFYDSHVMLRTSFEGGDLVGLGDIFNSPGLEITVGDMEEQQFRIYSANRQHYIEDELPHAFTFAPGDRMAMGNVLVTDRNGDPHHRREIVVGKASGRFAGRVTAHKYRHDPVRAVFTSVPMEVSFGPGDELALGNVRSGGAGADEEEVLVFNTDGLVEIYQQMNSAAVDSFHSPYQPGDGMSVGNVCGNGYIALDYDEVVVACHRVNKLMLYGREIGVPGINRLDMIDYFYTLDPGDSLAVGDVCGDDYQEILVADHTQDQIVIYQYNPVLDALEFVRLFNYHFEMGDRLLAGNVLPGGKDELLVFRRGEGHASHTPGEVEIIAYFEGEEPGDRFGLRRQIIEEWGPRLAEDFLSSGHLLILGESDIIPAFFRSWSLEGNSEYGDVRYTDRDYADTDDDRNRPELAVGRIIGNSAADLTGHIRTTLDLYWGGFRLDNDNALAVSGYNEGPSGGAADIDFVPRRDSSAGHLRGMGCTTTLLHTPSSNETVVFDHARDKDFIHLAGHGSTTGWDIIHRNEVLSDFQPGDTAPVVFAASCLTGHYAGRTSLAEAFINCNASAYVGATEVSFGSYSLPLANRFYDELGGGYTLGQALRRAKRNRSAAGRGGERAYNRYNSAVFHLYGDPKTGVSGLGGRTPGSSIPRSIKGPLSSLEVDIPDYIINSQGGYDHVSIPGQDLILESGRPEVPRYTVNVTFPAGSMIQEVTLLEKGSLETDSGLNLPVHVPLPDSAGPLVEARDAASGWWPRDDFEWSVYQEPDGSTLLVIGILPFQYDAATGEARFYTEYLFDIDFLETEVSVNRLMMERDVFQPGEMVTTDAFVRNSSQNPQDVIVEAAIMTLDEGMVFGLPLRTLTDLTGLASLSLHWDSSGKPPGSYQLQMRLRDTQGRLLDTAVSEFLLGSGQGRIAELSATPDSFGPGASVAVSALFENTGTTSLNGTLHLAVQRDHGSTLVDYSQPFPGLESGQSATLSRTWTADRSSGGCRLVASAAFEGKTTEPVILYLPGFERLFFPHVASDAQWETEVAMINTGDADFSGVLRAYAGNGSAVGSLNVQLPTNGRKQLTVGTSFPSPQTIRYLVLEGASGGVCGYTKFFESGGYRGALPASAVTAADDVPICHIASDPQWWTGIGLVNTSDQDKNLTLRCSTGQTNPLSIPSRGQKAFLIKDLFGGTAQPGMSSAVLEGAQGLVGLELFGQGWQLGGIRLSDRTATTLYFPHLHSDAVWWTGLVVYNPWNTPTTLTVTPYSATGTALPPQSVSIGPKGKYVGFARNLGLPATAAWLRVTASQPVSGFELFGTWDTKLLAGFSALDLARTTGVFPKLEDHGWTGISFVNTTGSPIEISLTAYDDAGTQVAVSSLALAANAKRVDFAEDLFAGDISTATYVGFTATGPVAGFQLNGSDDGWLLDGLPGM